jgi:hypothetical protein
VTILEALSIVKAAVLECKKRDINTPQLGATLNLLEPFIRPTWLIPQFRHHALSEPTDSAGDREGQQQVLRVTFSGIRDAVRELIKVRMDSLARRFAATHDMMIRGEINRLSGELI